MKKTLFTFAFLYSLAAFGQVPEFASIGTIWYYDYIQDNENEPNPNGYSGYIKYTSEKDTVIDGYNWKKISRYAKYYSKNTHTTTEQFLDPYFIQMENDTVWFHSPETSIKRFAGMLLTVTPGEQIALTKAYPDCIAEGNFDFTNLRTETFNGIQLACYDYDLTPSLASPLIVEGIGSLYGFFPNVPTPNTSCAQHTGALRCFSSPNGFLYKADARECEFVDMGDGSVATTTSNFSYYMIGNKLIISATNNTENDELKVYNLSGQILQNINTSFQPGLNEFDINIFHPGVYTIHFGQKFITKISIY